MDEKVPVELTALLAEGAEDFNRGAFWEAHEAWEEAWLDLKAQGATEQADYLQGLILATAGFENLARGKPAGFRVQLAKALHRLRRHAGQGRHLGLADEDAFREALTDVYLDVMRQKIGDLEELAGPPPRLELADDA